MRIRLSPFQFGLLLLLTGSFASADSMITAPPMPTLGPGGSNYPHAHATIRHSEFDGTSYTVVEPTAPTPVSAPVLVYLMGDMPVPLPSTLTFLVYEPMLRHIARKGYVVVFVSNQFSVSPAKPVLERSATSVLRLVRAALWRQAARPTRPARDAEGIQWAIGGHSRGGLISLLAANRAIEYGLAQPRALVLHESNAPESIRSNCAGDPSYDLCNQPVPSRFSGISEKAKLLLIRSSEADAQLLSDDGEPAEYSLSGIHAYADLWRRLPVKLENTSLIYLRRDTYGTPSVESKHLDPLASIHNFPQLGDLLRPFLGKVVDEFISLPGIADWNGYWRPSVALLDATFRGKNYEYVWGEGPQVTEMGRWSDGREVARLKTLRDFSNYFRKEAFEVAPALLSIQPGFPAADFGEVTTTGEPLNRRFRLKNEGIGNLKITSLRIAGEGFSVEANTERCQPPSTLSDYQICEFEIQFAPTNRRNFEAELRIGYISGGSPRLATRRLVGLGR